MHGKQSCQLILIDTRRHDGASFCGLHIVAQPNVNLQILIWSQIKCEDMKAWLGCNCHAKTPNAQHKDIQTAAEDYLCRQPIVGLLFCFALAMVLQKTKLSHSSLMPLQKGWCHVSPVFLSNHQIIRFAFSGHLWDAPIRAASGMRKFAFAS